MKDENNLEEALSELNPASQFSPAPVGTPVRKMRKRRHIHLVGEYHDIGTTLKMAIFIPGAGQLYNGQIVKGIALLLLTFGGILGLTIYPNRFTAAFGSVGEFALWLCGILDAGVIAWRLKRGQKISVWKWF